MASAKQSIYQVEKRSIDFIPPEERHGKPWHLFTIWFAANMQVTAVVTGALAVIVGLSLPWALLAIIIGCGVGAIFMALHSAQGPKLGIPQMIQSRAQFGFFGAVIPIVVVFLMYVGFFAASGVLGAQALTEWTKIPLNISIVITSVICTLLAIYGYRLIHSVQRWVSVLTGLGFLYLTFRLVADHNIGAAMSGGHFEIGTFVLAITIAATWEITYAPYVADYSRYLPSKTSVSAAFWWSYLGSAISSIWMLGFGAIAVAVAAHAFDGGSVAFIVGQSAAAPDLFIFIVIIGILGINTLNLYGAFMSSATTITVFARRDFRRQARVVIVAAAAVIGTVLAIAGQGDFLNNFENFILFLAYFIIPWTAINLCDFYLVRKERYNIRAIFDPDGEYGRWNWRALTAYGIGILLEIPFMSTTFYTGPMVNNLGGADISWMLSLVVAGGLYYIFMRPLMRSGKLQGSGGTEPALGPTAGE